MLKGPTKIQLPKKYSQLSTFLFPIKKFSPLILIAALKPFLITILTTTAITSLHAQDVAEYSARYQASANGVSAVAQREFIRINDNSYRLQIRLLAEIAGQQLAKLEQTSEIAFINNTFQPLSYNYMLSGISTVAHAINYNWEAKLALSRRDEESWTIDLNGAVWDQLSHQFALRQIFVNKKAETNSGEHEFLLIDGDEVEIHRYTVIGEEILITTLGSLSTVRLERIQEDSESRKTSIWLAKDWGYLLARIEQINDSGLRIEFDLENAVLGGKQVEALQ
ncbi:MAG: DUF3108 domain-containing protein [Gammaproteobacteria bacterium]|nr:DUF3108 domain-containing protein [Gammaproteobacteria bacterium]